jgi:hypothetical protein
MIAYYRAKAALARAGADLCDLIDKQLVMRLFRLSTGGGTLYNVTMNTSLDLADRAAYFDDVTYRALSKCVDIKRAILDDDLAEEFRVYKGVTEGFTSTCERAFAELEFDTYLDYYEHCVRGLRAEQAAIDDEFGLMFIH